MDTQPIYQILNTPNGTQTQYTTFGTPCGPLVVCLHGLGGSAETFFPLLPSVSSSYQIVCPDSEGLGKTPLSPGTTTLSFSRYVSDLHHLITHFQEHRRSTVAGASSTSDPVILIGHSLGAIISLHYAAAYPSNIRGLALLGAGRSIAGIPPAQQRMRDLAALARKQGMAAVADIAVKTNFPADRNVLEEHKSEVRKAVVASDPEGYARTAEAVASNEHHDPEYGLINCPVVFVAGDGDVISPVQRSKDLSGLVGGNSSVVVVRSGHQPILEDIDGVRTAIGQLLKEVESR